MTFPHWVMQAIFWVAFIYLCAIVMSSTVMVEAVGIGLPLAFTGLWLKDKYYERRSSKDIDEEYRLLIEESRKR